VSSMGGIRQRNLATTGVKTNRDKANGYAGLSMNGSDRLYQEDYGDGDFQPVYTIANAYPAPISSGAGDISVLERVRAGVAVVGRQGPDTPGWYGNTHYWNTEYVLDGTGSPVNQKVWDMMLTVCRVQNELMGWTPNMHIGHAHHTRRKIDLWAGQYADFDETIIQLRKQMAIEEDEMFGEWVVGLVEGYAEDVPFFQSTLERWVVEEKFHGNVSYWVSLLEQPENPEWRGFVSRTIFLGVL